MRIIAGTAKGRQLAPLRGEGIRPTPDRVREALFSILFSRCGSLAGFRVLDLFAGSGAMALEALSRGAAHALLIDRGAESARVVPLNVRTCGMKSCTIFSRDEVLHALPRLALQQPFDLVFLDPPYHKGLAVPVLAALSDHRLVCPGGVVCAETERGGDLPERIGTLVKFDRRDYGSTSIHLFSQTEDKESLP